MENEDKNSPQLFAEDINYIPPGAFSWHFKRRKDPRSSESMTHFFQFSSLLSFPSVLIQPATMMSFTFLVRGTTTPCLKFCHIFRMTHFFPKTYLIVSGILLVIPCQFDMCQCVKKGLCEFTENESKQNYLHKSSMKGNKQLVLP